MRLFTGACQWPRNLRSNKRDGREVSTGSEQYELNSTGSLFDGNTEEETGESCCWCLTMVAGVVAFFLDLIGVLE